ncbi:chitin deacetylase [Thoreauomyces humboldtii]|nr:chitin deacetylase [Thoreauomyces humboldtii]
MAPFRSILTASAVAASLFLSASAQQTAVPSSVEEVGGSPMIIATAAAAQPTPVVVVKPPTVAAPPPAAAPATPAAPVAPGAAAPASPFAAAIALQTVSPDFANPASAAAASYPNMPTSWPDPNQGHGPISLPALLGSPLVLAGMAKVKAAVPAALLALPLSTQKELAHGETTYHGDAAANCYWPIGQCFRDTAVAGSYPADVHSCPQPNTWTFTIDDGPTSAVDEAGLSTADLTAQLKSMNNQATTMFIVGSQTYYHADIVQTSYAAGHEIGVHTWTHPALTSLTNEQIVAEILYAEAAIVRTIGVQPQFFRPPFGDVDDRVRAIVGALGYTMVMWSPSNDDTSSDQADPPAATAAAAIQTLASTWFHAGPGFISLEHNLGVFTTTATIGILKQVQAAQAAGTFPLTLQTVGQCISKSPYVGLAAPVAPVPAVSTVKASVPTPAAGVSVAPKKVPKTVSAPVSSPSAIVDHVPIPTSATIVNVANLAVGAVFAAVVAVAAL